MKLKDIDVTKTIEEAKLFIESDKTLSPAARAIINLLIMVIQIFIGKISLNSKNSSTPPSQDKNREKAKKTASGKKPGGQKFRVGKNLEQTKTPDEIVEIAVDQSKLDDGEYKEIGYEARQVFDMKISLHVIEYRAQKLRGKDGKVIIAEFPAGINAGVQYGNSVKAHSVYMSQFQLVPYDRIKQHFEEQIKIPVSVGSIFNFNEEAYQKLEDFEKICKEKLSSSSLLHADETGINLNGKNIWLHSASNELWSYFYPHKNRGLEATDDIGILSKFRGVMVHDHWKPYYHYKECTHALCNSHHLRELQKVVDVEKHVWAGKMQDILYEINIKVQESGGFVDQELAEEYRQKYRLILKDGEIEAPLPPPKLNKDGSDSKKIKRSDARNLLERLQNFEDDVLRFMVEKEVPFTNNQAENEIRMTKVQQKISGCFRSEEGAKIFCRIRSYMLTCQKHGLSVTEALEIIFDGKLPHFCTPGE